MLSTEIRTLLWGLLAIGITLATAKVTNDRAEGKNSYTWGKETAVFLLVCFAVSLFTGYTAVEKSTSVHVWVVLMMSYITVLGAAVIDYKLHVIPNVFPVFLMAGKALVILYELCCTGNVKWDIISSLTGFGACFAVMIIAGTFTRGGIGKGDVKLLASIGFACGAYPVFVTLTIALLYCAVVSVLLIIIKKLSMKDSLPFGPFIFLGYLSMIYYI